MLNRVGMTNFATPYTTRNNKPAFQGLKKAEKELLRKELATNPQLKAMVRFLREELHENAILNGENPKFVDDFKLAKRAKALLKHEENNPGKSLREYHHRSK